MWLNGSPSRVNVILPRIMREEIETQRKITRQAQREFNALRVQLSKKREELELVKRHLQAFAVEGMASPKKKPISGDDQPQQQTPVERLKDEIQRMDAYKKKLRHMRDRLARHAHFIQANMELLDAKRVSTRREHVLLQDKVAQERNLCTELELKRTALQEERVMHALHSRQLLDSLREEIASRSLLSQQRDEADRRRDEMLRLVDSRSSDAVQPMSRKNSDAGSAAPRVTGRRDSFRVLLQDTPAALAPSFTMDSTDESPRKATASSHRLHFLRHHPSVGWNLSSGESLSVMYYRETYFQVYETQYARILTETGESDLTIVLQRYRTFHEDHKRLIQIDQELTKEQDRLEARRQQQQTHLQRLRLSGIAEVEKRKKIRDFFEQMHHIKSTGKTLAKDAFLELLKMFAYVQQGIFNIVELFKCLDERAVPPVPVLSTGSTCSSHGILGTSHAEIEWLAALVCYGLQVARVHPSAYTRFTSEEIERLARVDPALGVTASTVGGNEGVVAKPPWLTDHLQAGEIAVESDDDEDDDEDEEESGERERIKLNEVETLQQVELLFRTLDTKQAIASSDLMGLPPLRMSSSNVTRLSKEDKLAAVHAFFKQKRLREKQEEQQQRELLSFLAETTRKTSPAKTPRASPPPSSGSQHMSPTPGHASIVMAQRPATANAKSALASAVLSSLGGRGIQRKRSNAVSFTLPLPKATPSSSSSTDKHPRPVSHTPPMHQLVQRAPQSRKRG
ncbi:hypothetical protein Poli38472_014467 [Pythium oligandrum]|uniref:Uncharacterized protein n=1 Tax=Pythium oligandrum TaxID=41045 RepID=A0A8K1FFX0_PYTOL|nr:hypothetical protein Poli38472_014467 [Pythium oligandrum]|eukprot:TMW61006.1 hypothetical protein Poli38472_014467 [Pythium oligandrum]